MCVSVHYNAYLEYGDEPFDSTYLRKRPQSFNLGIFCVLLFLLVTEKICSLFISNTFVAPNVLGVPLRNYLISLKIQHLSMIRALCNRF